MRHDAHGAGAMRRTTTMSALMLVLAGPAAAQAPAETPAEQRAFCRRVAAAALRCGPTADLLGLSACLVRTLPWQDSLRLARTTAAARGDVTALLTECGAR
jgi:hypothetical protein